MPSLCAAPVFHGGREEWTTQMSDDNGRLAQGAATGARVASAAKDSTEKLGEKLRAANLKDAVHLTENPHLKDEAVHLKDEAVHLKNAVVEHAGPWVAKIRQTAPKLAKQQGKRAKDVAGEHPKGAMVAGVTAFGVFAMAWLRRMWRGRSRK